MGQWQNEVGQSRSWPGMLAEDSTAKGLAPQSVLGEGLFSMQSPKMHSTQVQGRMNTCEAEQALCLSKTRPFHTKATSHGTKITKGQEPFLKAHRASPYQHHCTTAAREEETKLPLSPVTLGMGCWLSQKSRRDSVYSPGHRQCHCCTW